MSKSKNDKNSNIKKIVERAKQAITTTVESLPSGLQKYGVAHKTTVPSRRINAKHLSLVPRKLTPGHAPLPSHTRPAKLSAGTRTRMLKIIYDHKKDLAVQQQRTFLLRISIAAVLVLGVSFGLSKAWGWMQESVYNSGIKAYAAEWWDKVTTPSQTQSPVQPTTAPIVSTSSAISPQPRLKPAKSHNRPVLKPTKPLNSKRSKATTRSRPK